MCASRMLATIGLTCCTLLAVWTGPWAQSVPPVQLAQDCKGMAEHLNAEIERFKSQCSGPLNPQAYDRSESWQNDLSRRIDDYNRICSR